MSSTTTARAMRDLPALVLTLADHVALVAGQETLREQVMWIRVVQNDDDFAELVHVWAPRQVPGQDDPRWAIWRNAAGIQAEDYDMGGHSWTATMQDALALVLAAVVSETAALKAAIPGWRWWRCSRRGNANHGHLQGHR